MKEIEAAKIYIEKSDPNHWFTKELNKCIQKGKIPHWAVKELVKKGILDNSFMLEKKENQLQQKEIDFTSFQKEKNLLDGLSWNQKTKQWIFPEGITPNDLPPNVKFMSAIFEEPPFTNEELSLLGPIKDIYTWEDLNSCWEIIYKNIEITKKEKLIYTFQESLKND